MYYICINKNTMKRLDANIVKLIDEMVKDGYINKSDHPTYDLHIYKYTPQTQFTQTWNEATLMCRGLILDSEYNVVEWPMRKFFNFEELGEDEKKRILSSDYQVSEKVDGSLGILLHYNGEYFMSTQGSFVSDQAIWATKLINEKYIDAVKQLDTDHYTYLFEIVYPDNKIVVDYGDFADIVFLAKIDKETGEDLLMSDNIEKEMSAFKIAKQYEEFENAEISRLKDLDWENKEGFVLHSVNGRVKVKFANYVELHRIMSNMTDKTVWEAMRDGNEAEMKETLPEEFLPWFDNTVEKFRQKANAIKERVVAEYAQVCNVLGENFSRKDFALYVLANFKENSGYLFLMLNNNGKVEEKLETAIFNSLKPVGDENEKATKL